MLLVLDLIKFYFLKFYVVNFVARAVGEKFYFFIVIVKVTTP